MNKKVNIKVFADIIGETPTCTSIEVAGVEFNGTGTETATREWLIAEGIDFHVGIEGDDAAIAALLTHINRAIDKALAKAEKEWEGTEDTEPTADEIPPMEGVGRTAYALQYGENWAGTM